MLKKEQREELDALSIPLIKWINANGHPHMKLIIENDGYELVEGVCANHTNEYIPD